MKTLLKTARKTQTKSNVRPSDILVISSKPVNIKDIYKNLFYQTDLGWYGLMSSDGHIITPPSFSEIKAVNADLFLCKDENGYSVLLDAKETALSNKKQARHSLIKMPCLLNYCSYMNAGYNVCLTI